MAKWFVSTGADGARRRIAEFRLELERVTITFVDPLDEPWVQLDSIMVDGVHLRPADGRAFYDGLDSAYPGSIERDDAGPPS